MVYLFTFNLSNNAPEIMPIIPYSKMLTTVAPINVEYFANGPRVSTAWDSISPEVIDIRPWDASSGINNPFMVIFKKIDNAKATSPAASP